MAETTQNPRFHVWSSNLVFSCVCLAAHVSDSAYGKNSSKEKWVLAALCMSLIFSFLGVVGSMLLKERFVGQYAEGGLSFLLLIIWCAALPVIMNPSNNIALAGAAILESPVLRNANLYFFSWICFACTCFIFGHYAQEISGRHATNLTPKNAKWVGIFAASLVVMVSASNFHLDGCRGNTLVSSSACARAAYGVSLGVVGVFICIIMLYMEAKQKLTLTVEFAVAVVTFIFYTFGVGFITFGSDAPAKSVSNLYFSTWIGFGVSLVLTSQCFNEVVSARSGAGAEGNQDSHAAPAPTLEEVKGAGTFTEGVAVEEEAP